MTRHESVVATSCLILSFTPISNLLVATMWNFHGCLTLHFHQTTTIITQNKDSRMLLFIVRRSLSSEEGRWWNVMMLKCGKVMRKESGRYCRVDWTNALIFIQQSRRRLFSSPPNRQNIIEHHRENVIIFLNEPSFYAHFSHLSFYDRNFYTFFLKKLPLRLSFFL